jgi:hypothetical protein
MGRHCWVGCGKQSCLCYILYVEQWRFLFSMSSGHHEWGFLDPRTPWADTCDVSAFDNPSTCSHSDDSGGAAVFVPSRTPRTSGYDFYAHVVYVVICYMSIICYTPVMSSSEPSSGSSDSVWIYRWTIFGK